MNIRMNQPLSSLAIIALGLTAIVAASRPTGVAVGQDRKPTAVQKAAIARSATMKVNVDVASPDLIAVRIHHDLCTYCKQLDPQFTKLIRNPDNDSVLFITLDLTSEATQQQAALLVGALGLENIWPDDLSELTTVKFIDGTTKRVISSIRAIDAKSMRAYDAKTLQAALENAASAAPGE